MARAALPASNVWSTQIIKLHTRGAGGTLLEEGSPEEEVWSGGQGPAGGLLGWWGVAMLELLLSAGAMYSECGGDDKGERVAGGHGRQWRGEGVGTG